MSCIGLIITKTISVYANAYGSTFRENESYSKSSRASYVSILSLYQKATKSCHTFCMSYIYTVQLSSLFVFFSFFLNFIQ